MKCGLELDQAVPDLLPYWPMSPSASCWIVSFSSELWLSYLESLHNGIQPRTGMPRDEVGDSTKAMGEAHPSQHKLPATPFPKFNPRDVEIFIIEAEAWFMFNQVYDHKSMMRTMRETPVGQCTDGVHCPITLVAIHLYLSRMFSLFFCQSK